MSRFHEIAAQLGLSLNDLPWVPTDDGTVMHGDQVVCVLGDPNEDLEAVDLENVVMVLVAPLLRRLVVELACDLATARGQDCPDWAVERTITTSALTTLEQAEAVFALLEQGE